MNKKDLTETEIRTRFITPAISAAGWDSHKNQVREEYRLAPGRIVVRGKLHSRGAPTFADYVLFLNPGLPLAVVEAKDNNHGLGDGMQQAQAYAEKLEVPFVFSSNGDGFLFHDETAPAGATEIELKLEEFPSPDELHAKWRAWKGLDPEAAEIVEQPLYDRGSDPRYYQLQAINRTVEAIVRGQRRALLVMATGTGKTYTASQIIWRLWKAKRVKRVLFLADRNILVDQTKVNDFKHFGPAMTKVTGRKADPAYEIQLAIYQALTGEEERQKIYKDFSPEFFDLIVVDECHRGSARDDSQWREILDYFSSAVHLGLTATPKETKDVSNVTYFGEPVFTYSLREGIQDGYLAPYKVVRVDLDKDLEGWRPEVGRRDKQGEEIEDRVYSQSDYDRQLVLEKRTQLVASKVTEFLKQSGDRFAKTIVFCQDVDHAERMRSALVNENADLVKENRKYVMRITGDDDEGKSELDNFINPESRYPVIATTSELLTTGVDAQTCELIVIDQTISSMSKFKQLIGRGTRINEEHGKYFFTIMDFRKATELFADPDFDGDPVVVYTPGPEDPVFPSDGGGETGPEGEGPATGPDGVGPEGGALGGGAGSGPRTKYYVDDVEVKVSAERVQYLDPDGRLITESLKDYSRKKILTRFESLDDFLRQWTDADKKSAIVDELRGLGVFFEELAEEVGKEFGAFDLICHLAFDQAPLSRRQRVDGVRRTGYWAKYSEKARSVLDALLEKYADDGVEPDSEGAEVLQIRPFRDLGTVVELVHEFGGANEYAEAIAELETHLYEVGGN